jgi:hypothetical protein
MTIPRAAGAITSFPVPSVLPVSMNVSHRDHREHRESDGRYSVEEHHD